MACSSSLPRLDSLSEDKFADILRWFNSKMVEGMSVKVLNVRKMSDESLWILDTDSNVVWMVSNELVSKLYCQYNGNQKDFLKFLASLRQEFLNGSSETLESFFEFTTTGSNVRKRQSGSLDPSKDSSLPPPVKKPKSRERKDEASTSSASEEASLETRRRKEEEQEQEKENELKKINSEYKFDLNNEMTDEEIQTQMSRFTELESTKDDVEFVLNAFECFDLEDVHLTSMKLEGEVIDQKLQLQLSLADFDAKIEPDLYCTTDFEDYFIKENESDTDSFENITLFHSRILLEKPGSLLEAIMNGDFVNFDLQFFETCKNSRINYTLCKQVMDEKISRYLRNYERIIYILEGKDTEIEHVDQVRGLWKEGNWREHEFFRVPDSRDIEDISIIEPKNKNKKKKFYMKEKKVLEYFKTFILFWENLKLIENTQKNATLDVEKMSFELRERCLLNIYVMRTILRFLHSRFIGSKENAIIKKRLTDLYYIIADSFYQRQIERKIKI